MTHRHCISSRLLMTSCLSSLTVSMPGNCCRKSTRNGSDLPRGGLIFDERGMRLTFQSEIERKIRSAGLCSVIAGRTWKGSPGDSSLTLVVGVSTPARGTRVACRHVCCLTWMAD